ncbi:Uncharacterized protein DBV15_07441 [Temnothorax longispinosus]|uniref:Uncharacterized protein n=1 Tax=Temnothorax longispinosus TaxID=300112 RepID=A0A4S2JAF4_9HYME|nr:Uncharacterized protein DBV15_07441 [Temnothorax longispinosus]
MKMISREALSSSNLIVLNRHYVWANINLGFNGILKGDDPSRDDRSQDNLMTKLLGIIEEIPCEIIDRGSPFLLKALRKTRHCMMPSIVSPVKQKVPLRCRPLRPITEQRLAWTKAFCDRVAAKKKMPIIKNVSISPLNCRKFVSVCGTFMSLVKKVTLIFEGAKDLKLSFKTGFGDRVNDPTAATATSIGKHLTESTAVVRASRVQRGNVPLFHYIPRLLVSSRTLGLAHEVAEARALDTMVARCRERKWSRGSHGEVITETKHRPCVQARRIC